MSLYQRWLNTDNVDSTKEYMLWFNEIERLDYVQ